MKKISKLLAFIMAILLIIGLLLFTNATYGNPISKAIVNHNAKEYLQEHYPNTDYYIDNVGYNFKFSNYVVQIKSDSSIDTYFNLEYSQTGKFLYDGYEVVSSKSNTYNRLESEYRSLVSSVLESATFPYKSDIQFGTLQLECEDSDDFMTCPTSIKQDDLVIDKIYDIKELSKTCGKLVIYTESDDLSFTNAAKILLDIRTIFDNANVPFAYIDFVLEEPRNENTKHNIYINIKNFAYEDIVDNDLVSKIEIAHNQLNDYYAKQDALIK